MDRKWKLIVVLSWVVFLTIICLQHMMFQQKLEYTQGYTEGYVQGYVPAYIQSHTQAKSGIITIPNPLQPTTQQVD